MLIDTDKLRKAIDDDMAERCDSIDKVKNDRVAANAYTILEKIQDENENVIRAIECLAQQYNMGE